ncbi:MAG: class I SAM-dependent DNA methyltransferase [Candidatus Latescibacterota bacterium]|jgi:SAM-dependent methyltransferase
MYVLPADYYDLLYSEKDYEREAHLLRDIITVRRPGAQLVLDLACGTGSHDEHLSRYYEVDGLDLHDGYIAKSRSRNPRGRYEVGDMQGFHLDRLYDVIICLFSSIAYVQTLDGVRQVLSRAGQHLAEGGLVIVEPWFSPEAWKVGPVHVRQIERDGMTLSRMCNSDTQGAISINCCHYLVGDEGRVRHFEEEHRLGLFSVREMGEAFAAAGLQVEYEERGLIGRGLYIGRKNDG